MAIGVLTMYGLDQRVQVLPANGALRGEQQADPRAAPGGSWHLSGPAVQARPPVDLPINSEPLGSEVSAAAHARELGAVDGQRTAFPWIPPRENSRGHGARAGDFPSGVDPVRLSRLPADLRQELQQDSQFSSGLHYQTPVNAFVGKENISQPPTGDDHDVPGIDVVGSGPAADELPSAFGKHQGQATAGQGFRHNAKASCAAAPAGGYSARGGAEPDEDEDCDAEDLPLTASFV